MMALGQFKKIANLTNDHFGQLCEAWRKCRLNWSYMCNVQTGFSLFDGVDREITKLEKTVFTTFDVEIPFGNHSIENLKKHNGLPLSIQEVQCEVKGCGKNHKFSFGIRFPKERSTLIFNCSPIKKSIPHFDHILHYYMVVKRQGKPDFFFPMAVMNKTEILSFIQGEGRDNPKAKVLIIFVFKR